MFSNVLVAIASVLSFVPFMLAYPVYTTLQVDGVNANAGRATWFYVGLGTFLSPTTHACLEVLILIYLCRRVWVHRHRP